MTSGSTWFSVRKASTAAKFVPVVGTGPGRRIFVVALVAVEPGGNFSSFLLSPHQGRLVSFSSPC